MNKPNPVGWFEIYVSDMDRAKTFYQNTFQTTLTRLESPDLEMWAFPMEMEKENYGSAGALAKMEGKDPGAGGIIIYFRCDDWAVEAARVVGNRGRIHAPKMSIGQYGFIALVYDTEGNMIGLHSMK